MKRAGATLIVILMMGAVSAQPTRRTICLLNWANKLIVCATHARPPLPAALSS